MFEILVEEGASTASLFKFEQDEYEHSRLCKIDDGDEDGLRARANLRVHWVNKGDSGGTPRIRLSSRDPLQSGQNAENSSLQQNAILERLEECVKEGFVLSHVQDVPVQRRA